MEYPLRHRRAWIVIGMAFVALVIYLSLTPHPIDFAQVHDSSGTRASIGLALAVTPLGRALELVERRWPA